MIQAMITRLTFIYYQIFHAVASATPPASTGFDPTGTSDGINAITDYIKAGVLAGGVIFIVIGGIQIATAIKSGEQNPEAITGAIKNIIIGGILLAIDGLVALFT